jgi:hypothetical protein
LQIARYEAVPSGIDPTTVGEITVFALENIAHASFGDARLSEHLPVGWPESTYPGVHWPIRHENWGEVIVVPVLHLIAGINKACRMKLPVGKFVEGYIRLPAVVYANVSLIYIPCF